jgi:hypothetical protein
MSAKLYADCANHRGQTALEIAVTREDTEMVQCLVRLGVGRKSLDCSLIRAAQLDNISLVKQLLDAPIIERKGQAVLFLLLFHDYFNQEFGFFKSAALLRVGATIFIGRFQVCRSHIVCL